MTAYVKDIVRTIRKEKKRLIALMVITVLGVTMTTGLKAACDDLRISADRFFDSQNLHDLMIQSTLGLTDEDIQALESLDAVQSVQGLYTETVQTPVGDGTRSVLVKTFTADGIDVPYVSEGRLPENSTEIAVSDGYLEAAGKQIGDTLTIEEDTDEEEETDEEEDADEEEDSEEVAADDRESSGSTETDDLTFDDMEDDWNDSEDSTDTPNFPHTTFTITGVVTDVTAVDNPNGSVSYRSSSQTDYTFFVLPEAVDSEYYTAVNLVIDGTKDMFCFSDEYEDTVESVTEIIESQIREQRQEARYEELVNEAEDKLADAQKRIDDAFREADEKLADAREELDDGWEELADGEKELNEQAEDARAQIAEARQEIADGAEELAEGDIQLKKAEEQVAAGEAKLKAGDKTLTAAEKKLTASEKQLTAAEKRLAETDRTLTAAEEKLAETDKTLTAAEKKLADSLAQIEEGEEQLAKGKEQLEKAKEELQAKQDAALSPITEGEAQLAEQKESLQSTIDSLNSQIAAAASLKEALGDSWSDEYTAAEVALGQAEAAMAEIEAKESELAAQKSAAEEPFAAAWEELGTQEKQLEASEKKLKESRAQWESGNKETEAGRKEWEAGKKQTEAGRKEWEAGKKQTEAGRSQWKAGKKQAEAGRAQWKAGKAQTEAGRKEWEAGVKELEAAKEQLAEGVRKAEAGKKELEEGEKELEEKESEAEQKIADARQELADGREELEDGESEYAEAVKTLEEKRSEADQKLADGQAEIDDIEMAAWYVQDRSDLDGYSDISSDADCIESLGGAFSLMFLIVAILISLTTIARMVEENRSLIGTYQALGFTSREIRRKYLVYSTAACVLGGLAGNLIGFLVLPEIIFIIFGTMYLLPEYELAWNALYGVGGTALFLAGIVGATWYTCHSVLAQQPAQLMRPKAPRAGSRILLERWGGIWKRLSFLNKVTARNLFRYKKRFLMTVLGIAGCTGLLLCGFAIKDTVDDLMPRQYDAINRYDILAVTSGGDNNEALTEAMEREEIADHVSLQISSVKLRNQAGDSINLQLYVIPEGDGLDGYITLYDTDRNPVVLEDDGFYVTENAGNVLGFGAGDTVSVQDLELNQASGTVECLVEYYLGNAVFVTEKFYEENLGEYDPNAVLLHLTDGTDPYSEVDLLKDLDGVLSVTSTQKLKDSFSTAFILINMVVYIVIIMAAALAFVVLFTLATTNISERERELATIKVLGFYDPEVHTYMNKETLILTGIGILLGMPLGRLLGQFLMAALKLPSINFAVTLHGRSYLIAGVMAFFFAILVDRITNRLLDRIDPVEALKSVE